MSKTTVRVNSYQIESIGFTNGPSNDYLSQDSCINYLNEATEKKLTIESKSPLKEIHSLLDPECKEVFDMEINTQISIIKFNDCLVAYETRTFPIYFGFGSSSILYETIIMFSGEMVTTDK